MPLGMNFVNNSECFHFLLNMSEAQWPYGKCARLWISRRAVRVLALAVVTVLCFWARQLTLRVPLSAQVYKCVPSRLMLGVTLQWTNILGGIELLLVASCYRNRDKLWPDEPLGSYACRLYLILYHFLLCFNCILHLWHY